ncbi:MAG: selenobiotic family peptide radical SAM maturase [Geobacter sp.]|nr:selenobiotic family peptide radical SAM maturase [Geobacter sp.]
MVNLRKIFPICCALLGSDAWQGILDVAEDGVKPADFPVILSKAGGPEISPYLPGLARLELANYEANTSNSSVVESDALALNPTLQVIPVEWKNLVPLLTRYKSRDLEKVKPGEEFILVWRDPASGIVNTQTAENSDLLAIKLVVEGLDPADVARSAQVPVGRIDAIMREAIWKGLILSPPSLLRREAAIADLAPDESYASAEVFTLQWHLTQKCDLHCRHCYDRSNRGSFPPGRALELLDELRSFCLSRFVRGQVSFSGGNPLMYPKFLDLYRAAAERDLMIAILGNATDRATIDQILEIQVPVYYQVSLEGLEAHNDEIRGKGNYRRTIEFLQTLTDMAVPNMVMLTLTSQNINQVIPLASELEGITGGLTFNRLALFGEGAALELPTPGEYRGFLEKFVVALKDHSVLSLKDSLLNTVFERDDSGLFGGCAGYGCGAAFNFISILSDGEVHACRKFPSPIGNIITDSLESIYDSQAAGRYRSGSTSCSGCRLNAVCRGCPAVTASLGLDPFSDKDPFCFRDERSS